MKRGSLIAALACALSVVAHAAEKPPASQPQAGFLRYEFNKWMFHACPSGKAAPGKSVGVPLIDATTGGILFKAVQQRWAQSIDPQRGVYLEFNGYQENQRVAATEFWRALGWVSSCAERPRNVAPGVVLWAAGNEPSWSFVADAAKVRFEALGESPLVFGVAKARTDGAATVWEGTSGAKRLRVEFTAELCNDTMAEAAFGRRVVAEIGSRRWSGCGLVR